MKVYCFHPGTVMSRCVGKVLAHLIHVDLAPYQPECFARDYDRLVDDMGACTACRMIVVLDCHRPQDLTLSRLWSLYVMLISCRSGLPSLFLVNRAMLAGIPGGLFPPSRCFRSVFSALGCLSACKPVSVDELGGTLSACSATALGKAGAAVRDQAVEDTEELVRRFKKILYNAPGPQDEVDSCETVGVLYRLSLLPTDTLRHWHFALHQVRKGLQHVILTPVCEQRRPVQGEDLFQQYWSDWTNAKPRLVSQDPRLESFRRRVDTAVEAARSGVIDRAAVTPLVSTVLALEDCIRT